MNRVLSTEATADVSDRDLVARCRGGDEEAFDTLVLRHQGRVFSIAYSVLLNHEDATEVAQDAFVKVYRNITGFRGDCEFTTWLYPIVVNLARNKRRWWVRRGKGSTVSIDCPQEGVEGGLASRAVAPTAAPDAEAVRAECVKRLEQEIAGLPAHQREVLLLRNLEDLSYERIAVMLNCSVGTVKSRIARAREALRQAMTGGL